MGGSWLQRCLCSSPFFYSRSWRLGSNCSGASFQMILGYWNRHLAPPAHLRQDGASDVSLRQLSPGRRRGRGFCFANVPNARSLELWIFTLCSPSRAPCHPNTCRLAATKTRTAIATVVVSAADTRTPNTRNDRRRCSRRPRSQSPVGSRI
jgi:hypothetical protein